MIVSTTWIETLRVYATLA